MSLAYVRHHYGVPAYRGAPILYTGGKTPRRGTVISADHRLRVRWDDDARRAILHPIWEIQYLSDDHQTREDVS
jgi:hypothetical protein